MDEYGEQQGGYEGAEGEVSGSRRGVHEGDAGETVQREQGQGMRNEE